MALVTRLEDIEANHLGTAGDPMPEPYPWRSTARQGDRTTKRTCGFCDQEVTVQQLNDHEVVFTEIEGKGWTYAHGSCYRRLKTSSPSSVEEQSLRADHRHGTQSEQDEEKKAVGVTPSSSPAPSAQNRRRAA